MFFRRDTLPKMQCRALGALYGGVRDCLVIAGGAIDGTPPRTFARWGCFGELRLDVALNFRA
jgi:hypothetical protein